jgi:hypothetical protein
MRPMSYLSFPFSFAAAYCSNRCNRVRNFILSVAIFTTAIVPSVRAQDSAPAASPYKKWPRGPSPESSFFPIAVWLQNPSNAERYRSAGFNTYVGLWQGPTEQQLGQLSKAGIRLICEQNEVALRHLEDRTIIGWMHGDEPDNAQELPNHAGYGPPVPPEKIVESFRRLRDKDPSRPVMLNLGQGVAWDEWYGRGSRSNHPEDYPKYIQGCDIVSFDIYPAVHDRPQIAGHLNYVGKGVERLVQWTAGTPRLVWNCIECTHISNPDRKPTPHEVRAEAWMSLIHGSRGLIYFVHEFKPRFKEAALLDDPQMLGAVTALNHEITSLAEVLNEPAAPGLVQARFSNSSDVPKTRAYKHQDATYVFAVEMNGKEGSVEFRLAGPVPFTNAEVLGENRTVAVHDGVFTDTFKPWDVHLYCLGGQRSQQRR